MDAGAKKLLETVTIETLHANNFSRASTQATQVLTDLLSRYLTLVTATCAKYAEHAGRLRLSARDAVSALGELGLDVQELSEYAATEGRELARYARHSTRRVEDLNEFKAALAVGLREDTDDAIPLVYAPWHTPVPSDDEYDASESSEEEEAEQEAGPSRRAGSTNGVHDTEDSHVEMLSQSPDRMVQSPRPITPTLPLSPISNPSTPPRKRPRTASWDPPEYIPDFLPPFPTESSRHHTAEVEESNTQNEYTPHHLVKLERPLTPPPESSLTGSADYLRPTPYAQSSLASQPWHLPEPPPATLRLPPHNAAQSLLPRADEAIIFALHHALTNKPPEIPPPPGPARHKVALKLVEQTQESARWDAPATLYASSAPNVPRVAPVGPGYPIPVAYDERTKEGKDKGKEMELEQASPAVPGLARRTVIPHDRLAPSIDMYTSKMTPLLKGVVEYGMYQRSTKMTYPPILSRGTQKLTYGPGIAAPWNSGPTPPLPSTTPIPNGVKGANNPNSANVKNEEKDAPPKPLPDARLYATWNWEEKSYREPLPPPARRPRVGSVQLGVPGAGGGLGAAVVGNGKRARSESHS